MLWRLDPTTSRQGTPPPGGDSHNYHPEVSLFVKTPGEGRVAPPNSGVSSAHVEDTPSPWTRQRRQNSVCVGRGLW